MTTEEKVFELLENTGLNWTVNKNQLFDAQGKETFSYGIFKKDQEWLGTVGPKYVPLQNWELATILIEATKNIDLEITKGGTLQNGKKIYLQACLPDEAIGNSNIKRYLTGLNAHDGTQSVAFGSTNTVVICSNTFYQAYGQLEKFRHTSSMKDRIEIAQQDFIEALNEEQGLMDAFKRMEREPLRDKAIERVLTRIFDVKPNQNQSEISTRKKNQIEKFADSLDTSIKEQGRTIWALFNGVTRYTNHVLNENSENKMDSIMTGRGHYISNMSFNTIMSYIEENSVVKSF